MKKQVLTVMIMVLFFASIGKSTTIWDVYTVPQQPLTDEVITIFASGGVAYADVGVDYSDLFLTESTVQLDLFFDFGGPHLPMVGPWSYSEDIGTLTAGTYELVVRTFDLPDAPDNPSDTYTTEFTVIPEPTMTILLGGGVILMRGRYGNKSCQHDHK